MKVSPLPTSSCRKARLRLRLGKLRLETFPNVTASLVPSAFVISQHRLRSDCIGNNRRRPTQSDLDANNLSSDYLNENGRLHPSSKAAS